MSIKEKITFKKLLFLFLMGITLLLILGWFLGKRPHPRVLPPTPTPEASPTPFAKPLLLLRTDPPSGLHETLAFAEGIRFVFNQAVDPTSLSFSVTPFIDLRASSGEGKEIVHLYPLALWQEKTEYTIKISQLRSLTGGYLEKEIIYRYQFVPVKDYPVW